MKFAQLPTLYCQTLQSLQPWLCLPLATVKETPKISSSVCTQTPALTSRVFVQSKCDSPLCAFPRGYPCSTFSSFISLKHKTPTKEHFLSALPPPSVAAVASFFLSLQILTFHTLSHALNSFLSLFTC